MDPLFLRKLLINQRLNIQNKSIQKTNKTDSVNANQNAQTNIQNQTENLAQNIRNEVLNPQQFKMNYLASMERSGYVKKIMNLPETLPELLMQLQNENSITDEIFNPQNNKEQQGNNVQQTKSDITEGIIRNAKESFDGVMEGVNRQINTPPKTELPQFEQPVNAEVKKSGNPAVQENNQQPQINKPIINQPKPEIPQEKQPTQNIPPQTRSNMPELSQPQQNINQPISNKPPVNTEVRHDTPQPQPTVPQIPNQPGQNKPVGQPQVKPNMPNVSQEQPIINKPVINQPRPEVPQQSISSMPHEQIPVNQTNISNKPIEQPSVGPGLPNIPQKSKQKPPIQQPEIHNGESNQAEPFNSNVNILQNNRNIVIQNLEKFQNRPLINPEEINKRPIHHHHFHHPKPQEIDENEQAQLVQQQLAQQNVQQEPTITEMKQKLSGDATELFFTGLINLNDLSNTLKTGGKNAKTKLIMAMANASRQGIDASQINNTLELVGAGIAAAQYSTPSKILKNIIELYLPWYPLQQGVGFDLSIETSPQENKSFLSLLKVWIQTRNYGNVNSILTLVSGNSVDMNIKCIDSFPKDDLLKRLKEETSTRSMQSNINVEQIERVESYINQEQQAKVNLSSTYELNPYLLFMAHSFIKNTIIIDSNTII